MGEETSMNDAEKFPERYRKSIGILTETLGTDAETAMAMMLMTATLTDLHPEDEQVVSIILKDCGAAEPEYA
jgi:hypothetical protein